MKVVACVIPAYEAAATLESVVRGLRAALPDAILIVVDDGSADATRLLFIAMIVAGIVGLKMVTP